MASKNIYRNGFNGENMTRAQAEQKVRDIQSLNAKVGAKGFEQKICGNDRDGYYVEETRKK